MPANGHECVVVKCMRKTHAIICSLVLLCLLWPISLGAAAEGVWQTLETLHALVRYQSPQDLERFDKKIDYEPGRSGLKWIFGNKQDGSTADRATRKVDAIYARVQEILEMNKKSPRKVCINLYADHITYNIFRTFEAVASIWLNKGCETKHLAREGGHHVRQCIEKYG